MQREGLNKLYQTLEGIVPKNVLTSKNRARTWLYGHNVKYDIIVISKTGQIGDIIIIEGLRIALPLTPKKCYERSKNKKEQYWERQEIPKTLDKIQSIFQWNEMSSDFKDRWVEYVESEFDRREQGMWFMSNGKPTYITGAQYLSLIHI